MVLDMLNYFGKIFAVGFFRTLGKIFAFLIVGVVIVWLTGFINMSNVNAVIDNPNSSVSYNTAFGSYLDTVTYFKDFNTGNLYYSPIHHEQFGVGAFVYTISYSKIDVREFFVLSDKGMGISQCGYSFVKDNYYTLTVSYVTYNTKYVHLTWANGHNFIGLGESWQDALSEDNMNIPFYNYSKGHDWTQLGDNYHFLQQNTVTFKAPKDATCFSFPVNYLNGSEDSDHVKFVGYKIEYSGIDPLNDSQVEGIVKAEANNINQNIDIMKEKQDETNQKLDEVNNTMKDDNVDTGQAGGFFDSFDNIDHGGISGVITAPLSAINKINKPCSAISINLWDKDISLPCGDTLFWNKSSVSAFRNIWNILVGGPIIYALMVKLFHVIQSLKNPDDSRVEVAKL